MGNSRQDSYTGGGGGKMSKIGILLALIVIAIGIAIFVLRRYMTGR